ncbi:hypothetical protein NM688_g4404 [Phlebia brevispora]|uniref:Uncharacterized protein n=1 Tax=Phlebia brevispora TaxID=194682 RepID=A0ACC1T373_9APHY|nr:hypothetical protein NM688_g4404 [Phlebia brevispora]
MDNSPTSLFESYEQDFQQLVGSVREKLEGDNKDERGEQRKTDLRRADMELDEAEEMVSQMEIEIQGMPQSIRPQYQARLKTAKGDLQRYKKSLKDISAQVARAELLGHRSGADTPTSDEPYGATDRTRLLSDMAILEDGSRRLQDSQRIALETEEQGSEILRNLRGQREQIENARDTLGRADTSIDRATGTLKKMIRRRVRMSSQDVATSGVDRGHHRVPHLAHILPSSLLSPFELAQMDVTLVLASRYLAAIAVTSFLWDYLLTLGDEFEYVWKGPRWSLSQICYLWNRYTTITGLVYGAFLTSGMQPPMSDTRLTLRYGPPMTSPRCKASYVCVTTLAIIATAATHGYIALRLFILWDQKRFAQMLLWAAFVVTFLGLAVSCVFANRDIYRGTSYSSALKNCVLSQNPKPFMGVWVSMLTFDLVTILLVVSNALDQPYQQRFQVIERVKRDGALSFMAIVVASLVMLIMSIAGGAGSVFEVAFLAWAWDAIVVSRLVLRVESVRTHFTNVTNNRRLGNVYEMNLWGSRSSPSNPSTQA